MVSKREKIISPTIGCTPNHLARSQQLANGKLWDQAGDDLPLDFRAGVLGIRN